jgi:hypothetical protein
MKNLEKEYDINRYDISTSDKLFLKQYSEIIKSHDQFDIRLEHRIKEEMLTLTQKSMRKIFSLVKEIPEEHILFLYMGENGNNKNFNFLPPIDTSLLINNLDNSDKKLGSIKFNKNKMKKNQTNIKPQISQYLCIFSILFFIMSGLLFIHFMQFILSEQVRYISIIIFIGKLLLLFISLSLFNRNFRISWIHAYTKF